MFRKRIRNKENLIILYFLLVIRYSLFMLKCSIKAKEGGTLMKIKMPKAFKTLSYALVFLVGLGLGAIIFDDGPRFAWAKKGVLDYFFFKGGRQWSNYRRVMVHVELQPRQANEYKIYKAYVHDDNKARVYIKRK